MIARVLRVVVAGSLIAFVGCGGPPSLDAGPVATVPAKGRVVRADGQPVTGGTIVFSPTIDGGSANQATGQIEPDGTFVLGSVAPKDGAVPGKYRVTVENDPAKAKRKRGAEVFAEIRPGQDLEIKLP